MNRMFVIVFPMNDTKDERGKYTQMEYLYFRRQSDALRCLAEQSYVDGHEWYEVPYFHKGALVRHNRVLYSWDRKHFVEAEDYALAYGLKLIEFDRSWLE